MERAEIMSNSTIDIEKEFHKIQYHFVIKTLSNQEKKQELPQPDKRHLW